ncbi:hypothetical protein KKG52_01830, partial [Patescibacteria group bacterium]|nr:hypothetical protein [Patescibacteria group bacterium]
MINKQSIITNQQYSIVFFGSGAYGLIVLENLDIKLAPRLILTTDKNNSDPVARYAIKNKIEHKKISNINNATIIEAIKFPKPQVGILANFGLIIPNKVLELFPKGILNIHPSLLPKYRGPTP